MFSVHSSYRSARAPRRHSVGLSTFNRRAGGRRGAQGGAWVGGWLSEWGVRTPALGTSASAAPRPFGNSAGLPGVRIKLFKRRSGVKSEDRVAVVWHGGRGVRTATAGPAVQRATLWA